MSGIAYFFKPKISGADSASSTTEKRPGRRSKAVKSSETPIAIEKNVQPMETNDPLPETKIITEELTEENPPTPTPKIKLKFNLRSQSVQDTSDSCIITNITHETNELSADESSDNEVRLKIDDHNENYEQPDSPLPIKHDDSSLLIISPSKKKQQSSRKKVISRLIGTTVNTLSLDEPSPVKIPPHDSQFSEVKQTKSGRTIKYTPYFKELVQGATISPPLSPVHQTAPPKRPSNYSKKKQTSIKADLDAIKNGSLPATANAKGRKSSAGSPKNKKQATAPVKHVGAGRKSTTPKAKTKRDSNQMVIADDIESDDENEMIDRRSDDEEFHQEGHSSEEDDEDGLDVDDDDHSSGVLSDEEEWTAIGNKQEHDRSLGLAATLGSMSSEMLDGYSLWAMKYRARHRTMSLDDKRLYRTWKKMSAHDRQRWCIKAEKESYHYPITAELLKASTSTEPTTTPTTKTTKSTKRKKPTDDPPPILLQKTLNQYAKQQPAIRPPNAFVKQPVTPTIIAPPKNYDIADIAAGIYLLGESLTKMGEKVRQLGHLNPRGTSAATSIDNLSAILFDGTLCACNLMACLGNEIISTNSSTSKSDPLTNKLMENVGIILPGLN
ncbi:unnamed protein product [Rotaria socialis]|uniref:Uncharacterized protein n=1 Tax=Rotaria socialis TaxID=392032 RepID=A0A818JFP7_9BILA|nr:unnamed protein product [Rotaria socialis]CAF3538658.1 unnamed protein product [Rotaria socialis]CAF3678470.1 unnamed protein product [Rotaria socialis]CAF3703504.1 unnamed protein product [Rotaria socialis]CAF4291747.1 unnamed protein product [Rotaria socialis]